MDSIVDTGELRTDNTAGGAETMRFRCEYVISNREPIRNTNLAIGFFPYVGINTKSLKRGIFQVKSSKRGYSEVFPYLIM